MWTINLEDLDDFLKKNKDIDSLQKEGLQNLLTGLDEFFEEESTMSIDDDAQMEFFASAALDSTDIICATTKFHRKPMFSNVVISAKVDEKDVNWYGLVSNIHII